MNIENERKLFEELAKSESLNISKFISRGDYLYKDTQRCWKAWQASANRDGFVLVENEMTWVNADRLASKQWDKYQRSHEIQNQGQNATALSIEQARLSWCKNKAHELINEYKAMIKASQENKDD